MGRLAELSRAVHPDLRSDKSDEYLALYEELLGPIAQRPLNVLEVGVLHGGSTLLFAKYLPRARLLAVDVNEPPPLFSDELRREGLEDRVEVAIGSQTDAEFLRAAVRRCFGDEPLDLVVDDASHVYEATRITFETIFVDHVRPGGHYVIEDWGCGYWPRWADGDRDGFHGLPLLVKELVDLLALEDRTRDWQGERALDVETQQRSPIDRATLIKGVAVFTRSDA